MIHDRSSPVPSFLLPSGWPVARGQSPRSSQVFGESSQESSGCSRFKADCAIQIWFVHYFDVILATIDPNANTAYWLVHCTFLE